MSNIFPFFFVPLFNSLFDFQCVFYNCLFFLKKKKTLLNKDFLYKIKNSPHEKENEENRK